MNDVNVVLLPSTAVDGLVPWPLEPYSVIVGLVTPVPLRAMVSGELVALDLIVMVAA
jgi:hypothetical protein